VAKKEIGRIYGILPKNWTTCQGEFVAWVDTRLDTISPNNGTRFFSIPNALEETTDKIYGIVENFKDVITKIDRNMVADWVRDLVLLKMFVG
jgi:hypothetical protein